MPEPLLVPFGTFLKPEYRNGLVGHWRMNVNSGMLLPDLSGYNNHGTLTNMAFPPTAISGWSGNGLIFDGVNDYAYLGSPLGLNLSGEMSVFAWINPTVINTRRIIFGQASSTAGGQYQLEIGFVSGEISVIWANGGVIKSTTGANLQINRWYHVGFVRSGIAGNWTCTIYINGKLFATWGGLTINPGNSIGGTSIGRAGDFNNYHFSGIIDDVRIFNRVLNVDEIAHSCYQQEEEWDFGIDEVMEGGTPIELLQGQVR